jgi:8-oxo-dGTP pyrophosphatase MutT (NUDIX family)
MKHQPITTDPDFWIRSRHSATQLCLGYRVDTYGGVILDSMNLPDDIEDFKESLECSLNILETQGFQKAYWIRIPTANIEFVPICLREYGFYIHHAKKEYVMLVRWSNPSKPDPIPPPSTHQVGVGCVIVRSDGCVLLVKERTGPASVGAGIWKLPTGLADPAEDIADAALREAYEETGLHCSFESIVALRHSHGGSPSLGATSDLFFACLLRPRDESQQTVIQEAEILELQWVHHSSLHATTQCGEGTAAYELMESVRAAASGDASCVIHGSKLPAWRRKNFDQWIFRPVAAESSRL